VIEAEAGIEINAPVEVVFDLVADATNEPAWLPGAQRVEKVTPGPVTLGTRFDGTYARAGAVSLEIVDFRRPSAVTLRARSRIVNFDDAIELEAGGDGVTRLHARMAARPRGVMRLFGPLMARTMRTQFTDNWQHLKRWVEASRQ